METTTLVSKTTVRVNAPATEVWKALTSPELIKQYFFGTEATSDWKRGSSIVFKGEWEGKSYEDKGVIKEVIPNKFLHYTYWTSMSGKPDLEENYANIIYELTSEGNSTILTITQDNIPNEQGREESEKNWQMVLNNLKKLIEK